ncbi:MAG: hypothetical protein AAF957_00770 [Planctomycetota bacterium]
MLAQLASIAVLAASSTAFSAAQETDPPEDRRIATVPDKHDLPTAFAFSPDGERVAFLARKKRRLYAYVDGEDVGYGDDGYTPVFSENGEHVFISLVKRNKNRTEKWTVYCDGEVVAREDWIGPLTSSFDGDTIAFWTQPGYRTDKEGESILERACLVIAHRKKRAFRQTKSKVYEWGATFEAPLLVENDTRVVGNTYWDGTGTIVSVGGKKDEVLHSRTGYFLHATWTKDGSHVAAVIRNYGDRDSFTERPPYSPYEVFVDGRVTNVQADAWALPTWSPNGEHLAFGFHRDERFGVGVGEAMVPLGEDPILRVMVDSSGTRLVWVVREGGEAPPSTWLRRYARSEVLGGRERVGMIEIVPELGGIPEGEEIEPTLGNKFEEIGQLVFTPDEERLVYTARDGAMWFVVSGEDRIGPFDAVGKLRFLDDRTVAIGTREGRDFWTRHLRLTDG